MKIVLLCRSLNRGGTERQLVTLAKGLHRRGIDVTVLVFYGVGDLKKELHACGVKVVDLRKSGRWDVLPFLQRLMRVVRELEPDIVYGFLGPANMLASLLRVFLPGFRVVWGVRAANVDLNQYDWLSRATYRVERRLSRFADLIICNSHAGMEYAAAHGFPKKKMRFIPNGIDTEKFKPDSAARARLRDEFDIGETERLIGLVGRLDPMKDHETFLRAAAMLASGRSDCRFVCAGDGPSAYRVHLQQLAADLDLESKLIWCGERGDIPDVFNAMDLACSSSYGEGFSNVIAEGMACGIPYVVTDVGDSASIVEGTGIVVPPQMPSALCEGMRLMLTKIGPDLSVAVRRSVVDRFTNEVLVNNTLEMLCRMG
jgi:glycosyltransferase involved in cell wall biosynthesis